MSKEPGPHVVARSSIGTGTEPVKSDEVRPTSKLDSRELRGLVGRTGEPPRAKRPTDLDVSFEVVSSPEQLAPAQPRARGGRVVQTVPRSSLRRAPEPVHAAGSAPLPLAPLAAADPDDPFADMFADAPAAAAPVVAAEELEPVQHFELEANEPDAPVHRAADVAPISAPYVVPAAPERAPEPAAAELDDLAIAIAPGPVAAPIVASSPAIHASAATSNAASFVRQIALGIAIGCVGLGVYLGIAASI